MSRPASIDVQLRTSDELKVAITAPPVDGQANAHLVKFLAQHRSMYSY
ncbi:hypothetical protein C5706_33285, partial [Klebsiella pneumoniae]